VCSHESTTRQAIVAGRLAAALLALAAALANSGHASAPAAQTAHTTTSQRTTTSETIHTTANHPWLTADRGWVAAGELRADEPLMTLGGTTSTVAWVQVTPGQADMYNLALTAVRKSQRAPLA
jgi:hypothetical protein